MTKLKPGLSLLVLLPVTVVLLTFHFLPNFAEWIPHYDLSSGWEICRTEQLAKPFGSNSFTSLETYLSTCRWEAIVAPSRSTPTLNSDSQPFLVVARNNFRTTSIRLFKNDRPQLIIGQAENFIAYLNGVRIGSNGDHLSTQEYNKVYPVRIPISDSSLNSSDTPNSLILFFHVNKIPSVGLMDSGPIGIYSSGQAKIVTELLTAERIVLPLLAAIGLLLLFGFATTYYFSSTKKDILLIYFAVYCVLSTGFLFSLTRIPRQYISLPFAMSLHYALRFQAYAALSVLFGEILSRQRLLFRTLSAVLLVPSLAFLGRSALNSVSIPLSDTFTLALYLHPFSTLIYYVAFLLSIKSQSTSVEYRFLSRFLFVALVTATYDTLAFWGIMPEHYFSRFWSLLDALAIGYVIWSREFHKRNELEKEAGAGRLAGQVYHDIQSPLAALKVLAQSDQVANSEELSILKTTIKRISDIASDLANVSSIRPEHQSSYHSSYQDFIDIVYQAITEKRQEYSSLSGVIFKHSVETLPAERIKIYFQPHVLARIISNLINNSIESMQRPIGNIELSVRKVGSEILLFISDDGPGIPADILTLLKTQPVTFGKTKGTGLGIKHARETIRAWGGRIDITSKADSGTTVTIHFPFV